MAAEEGNPTHGDENPKGGVEVGEQNCDDNPWKLERSDQPGMALISVVLTGSNYHLWSRFMTIALRAKGKLGFVNGEIKAPDEHSAKYEQWKQTDCMVYCWILNSVSEEIMKASIYVDTAKDLWDELEHIYGGQNIPMVTLKIRESDNCRQGSDSVTVYYTKFEKLWNEMVISIPWHVGSCDVMMNSKSVKLSRFIRGLNERFGRRGLEIMLRIPLPSVYKAYSELLLVEEEE